MANSCAYDFGQGNGGGGVHRRCRPMLRSQLRCPGGTLWGALLRGEGASSIGSVSSFRLGTHIVGGNHNYATSSDYFIATVSYVLGNQARATGVETKL